MPYATTANLFALGLSAAAFVVAPRPILALDRPTGTFTLPGHGQSLNDVVQLDLQSRSAIPGPTPALPTGFSAALSYFALPTSDRSLQLAATANGAAIIPSDSGAGGFVLIPSVGATLLAALEAASDTIDQNLTAYRTPLVPFPSGPYAGRYLPGIVALCARMAARDLLGPGMLQNPEWRVTGELLKEAEVRDQATLARWFAGATVNGMPVDYAGLSGSADGAVSLGGDLRSTFAGDCGTL